MEALKCAFFNYIFMIKRIPSSLNIFIKENKGCYVYLPTPYNRPSFSRNHQTVTIMNQCCYCFDGSCKVKTKYIVLRLNTFGLITECKRSISPALMDNCPTCSHMSWPCQSTKCFAIRLFQVGCRAWDSVATRKVPLEKKVDIKCMQGNIFKNIAKMTRRLCSYHVTHAF